MLCAHVRGVANIDVRVIGEERDHETKAQAKLCSARTVHRMDQVVAYVKPLKEFMKDSKRLVQRCTKPDLKGKPGPPNISPWLLPVIISFFLEGFGAGIRSCLIKGFSPLPSLLRDQPWSGSTVVSSD